MAKGNAPKYMNLEEFKQAGYLQEINRTFLHPLGLALEVLVDKKTGKASSLGGIQDYRHLPGGLVFSPEILDPDKAAAVQAEGRKRAEERRQNLGAIVQPIVTPSE